MTGSYENAVSAATRTSPFMRLARSIVKTELAALGRLDWSLGVSARYRTRMNDAAAVKPLASLVKRLERAGHEIHGKTYKQPPRGFTGSPAAADLVLHSGLSAGTERKSPPELSSAKLVTYCAREWNKLAPLHRWLVDEVG